MEIEAVLFDLDDTLTDWDSAIAAAVRHAVESAALPIETARHVHHMMRELVWVRRDGRVVDRQPWRLFGWRQPWEMALGDHEALPSIVDTFSSALSPSMYPDISLLADLRREYRIGLLTNNPYGRAALERAGILDLFEVVVMAEEPDRKPHPRAFADGCGAIGCSPQSTAYVGDSLANDVEGAHAAGLVPIWMDRFDDGYELPSGMHRVTGIHELRDLLRSLRHA